MTPQVHHHCIVEGQDFGYAAERDLSWSFEGTDGLVSANSYAYVCPTCLYPWATLRIRGWEWKRWEVLAHPCKLHPTDRFSVAGSLIVRWGAFVRDPYLLESLPPQLLERELSLHLAHWERYNMEVTNG